MTKQTNCSAFAPTGALMGFVSLGLLAGVALVGGCQPSGGVSASGPYILFNQRVIEGSYYDGLDLDDPDAVFATIFAALPDEVLVYPTENYYYFIMYAGGYQIWGNIRLPAGERDAGLLSFGYFEFHEFPIGATDEKDVSHSKFFSQRDGLIIDRVDAFTYNVRYKGKSVTFRFKELPQTPPKTFALGKDEKFIEQTIDESGYRFFLLFNTVRNYFFWVLNEELGLPDKLEPAPARPTYGKEAETPKPASVELVAGKRSGFVFWVDKEHGNRKVLVSIRQINSRRNDYYDGPFDQLADNYVDQARVAEYMMLAAPALKGRIDKYGYYTDQPKPMRVALSAYYSYRSPSDLWMFVDRAMASDDPYQFISRRGMPTPEEVKRMQEAAEPAPTEPEPEAPQP